jgi:hypothetical protein
MQNFPEPLTLMQFLGSTAPLERASEYVRKGGELFVTRFMTQRDGWGQANLRRQSQMLLEVVAMEGEPAPGTLAGNNPKYNWAVRCFLAAAQVCLEQRNQLILLIRFHVHKNQTCLCPVPVRAEAGQPGRGAAGSGGAGGGRPGGGGGRAAAAV